MALAWHSAKEIQICSERSAHALQRALAMVAHGETVTFPVIIGRQRTSALVCVHAMPSTDAARRVHNARS